ncbi:hypothetical protein A2954_05215 [Candidatus Roizmanbacteria bacterium RIFCSPLOWO2_01_FULL_37_12]|uniref:Aminoacyl-transfer RNA synthetases class-II family profile domain-containing protein n=1 Tax=Candidatus Roizmanbacteria bacterium RIFCSPLOWO2_01_FULL_37_12 TaxID=1802056 RepID=A0A1F7I8X4_9BACT|nr:MAG: hypothetical protein A2768_02310 [Candidatus Roizmanbacteria bacterium RIFCSPHIGHO2_01_FULL_37_16]OGK23022.1 MAG: hypothetical protein A3D76_06505 [Candidatus Roizmanbacteria bacterium RIFCSPHIGHO2_02_FULL_37_9b]OGK39794.1 MAG: hypothetical protein A2954_05215 [Candidatus Roizmanbacteria bacterium RIFCSPLOWO2_01_FULL_37_12]
MRIKSNIQNLNNYKIQLQVEQAVHEFMQYKGYLKLDLPVMSPALIPESYLEIFETEFNYFKRKEKLYLTPSPELFMKRLLTQGIGDIYYLGKSFRNSEPNSSFHLPEFTMLEFYKVGVTYLELSNEILEMMRFIADKITRTRNFVHKKINKTLFYQGRKISFEKWEKFTVAQAFEKFAQIKEKELFNEKLFLERAKEKGYIIDYSSSGIEKNKSSSRQARTVNFTFQDIFSQLIAQEIEPKLGISGYPTMLYDYPKEMSSLAKLSMDGKTAKRVEFYINGIEVGGCCEELNDWREQDIRFKRENLKRKKESKINHRVDNGFIEALKYGLPDCTGAGIGFERLAMIYAGVSSIEELKLINIS